MSVRLVTERIGDEIVKLIKEADQEIILVSPYNDSWIEKQLVDDLKKRRNKGVKITMYYQESNKKNQDPGQFFRGVDSHPVKGLHAKIYANEKTVLITSYNLTGKSFYSKEAGLVVQDAALVQEVRNYVKTLDKDVAMSRGTMKSPKKGKMVKTAQGSKEVALARSDARATGGWKAEVLDCIQKLKKREFTNQEFYSHFSKELSRRHPNVKDVESAIRVQFQALEKDGVLESEGYGHWRYRRRR